MSSKLVVIVGQTASGKSGLAHKAALEHDGEIIAADSRTIYKGMDIGTAKPSKQDRGEISYWGLDLVEPGEDYNVANFQAYTKSKIGEISKRGSLPIMVGGTGLYVDSVLFDYSFGESKNKELRSKLDNKSLEELQEIIAKDGIDAPDSVMKNKRHLIRIIERNSSPNNRNEQSSNTLVVGLNPSRSSIRYNIEQRVELMFKKGLRKEVDELVNKYGWENEALTGIGYREFKPWYGKQKSMGEVKKSIVKSTLQYAKRQRTWFKRNPNIEWFESSEEALKRIALYANDEL